MQDNILQEVDEKEPELMKTILFPKKIHSLTGRFPEANYSPLKTRKINKKQFIQTLEAGTGSSRQYIIPKGKKDDNRSKSNKSVKQK